MLATALLLLALPVAQPQPPQADATTTAVGVVVEVSGREAGPVEIWRDGRLVAILSAGHGPSTFATNAPGDGAFAATGSTGDGAAHGAEAGPGVLSAAPAPATSSGAVAVSVPVGFLTASVQRSPDGRVSLVTVTDTRAGELGFTVTATSPTRNRITRVWAEQLPDNALESSSLRLTHRVAMPAGRPVRIARHPEQESLGSVRIGVETATTARLTWTVL